MSDEPLSLVSRLILAHVTWARVLTDGAFARRIEALDEPGRALLAAKSSKNAVAAPAPEKAAPGPATPGNPPATPPPNGVCAITAPFLASGAAPTPDGRDIESALRLLARLQSEGRLLDFLQDDLAGFSDAEIGATARVVHDGCARALRETFPLAPVRDEQEGATVVLAAGFDKTSHKLTGNVAGSPPYTGVLRHRGWRVREVLLGPTIAQTDASVVAPAEVEL